MTILCFLLSSVPLLPIPLFTHHGCSFFTFHWENEHPWQRICKSFHPHRDLPTHFAVLFPTVWVSASLTPALSPEDLLPSPLLLKNTTTAVLILWSWITHLYSLCSFGFSIMLTIPIRVPLCWYCFHLKNLQVCFGPHPPFQLSLHYLLWFTVKLLEKLSVPTGSHFSPLWVTVQVNLLKVNSDVHTMSSGHILWLSSNWTYPLHLLFLKDYLFIH